MKVTGKELWSARVDGKLLSSADSQANSRFQKARCLLEWCTALGKLRKVKFPQQVKRLQEEAARAFVALSAGPLDKSLKGQVDYHSAMLEMERGELASARKNLLEFANSMPDHALAPSVLFEEARSWEEEDSAMARTHYQALITRYKQSEKVADAMVQIGVLYSKDKKHELAATVLMQYLERFPNSEIAPKVHYKIAQCTLVRLRRRGVLSYMNLLPKSS